VIPRGCTIVAATLALAGLAGCGRDRTVANCEPTARYATATSSPPIQIPDDLTPPDESDSLRLPATTSGTAPSQPCLESPPGFYAEGAAVGTRLGTAPARPAPAAPATTPAAPPAEDPDRRIDN
jgi:uncharacterized lipoprotein